MILTLKPTRLPSKPADDYEVFDENRNPIGRILKTHHLTDPWMWTLIRGTKPQPPHHRGSVVSLEDAKLAFKAAWEALPQ